MLARSFPNPPYTHDLMIKLTPSSQSHQYIFKNTASIFVNFPSGDLYVPQYENNARFGSYTQNQLCDDSLSPRTKYVQGLVLVIIFSLYVMEISNR